MPRLEQRTTKLHYKFVSQVLWRVEYGSVFVLSFRACVCRFCAVKGSDFELGLPSGPLHSAALRVEARLRELRLSLLLFFERVNPFLCFRYEPPARQKI